MSLADMALSFRARAGNAPLVAVLSCTYGGGHNRVAEVLASELRLRAPGSRVEIFDYIETFVGRLHNRVSTAFYMNAVRRAPWSWRWFYRATAAIPYDSPWQRALNRLGKARLERYLRERRPDLIVCTYCVPAGAISELKAHGHTDVPCVTVITDHAIHSQWIHPHVDQYVVSSDHVRAGLIARGIPARRIAVTGIPIDPRFAVPADRSRLRIAYGLHHATPVALVMVGAANLLRHAMLVYHALADLPRDVQVIFICGHDARLRRRLEALVPGARNTVQVHGFTRDVHRLMACSDFMVSKAGGVTSSEALAAELPMVIVSPIPGQEEENADFLQDAGAAVLIRAVTDLRDVVTQLLDHPSRLERMRVAARRLKRPDAASRAADVALTLCRVPTAVPVDA